MWCSKILVAYDDSDSSKKALDKALEIAESDERIEIEIVHVMKLHAMTCAEMDHLQAFENMFYQQAKEMLARVSEQLKSLNNRKRVELLEGISPSEVLLRYAEENGFDLVVMGSRGRGGVKSFLGSVSHAVVHQAKMPVLIIK